MQNFAVWQTKSSPWHRSAAALHFSLLVLPRTIQNYFSPQPARDVEHTSLQTRSFLLSKQDPAHSFQQFHSICIPVCSPFKSMFLTELMHFLFSFLLCPTEYLAIWQSPRA